MSFLRFLLFVSLTRACNSKNMQRGDSHAHKSPCSSAAMQQGYDLLAEDRVADRIQNKQEGGFRFYVGFCWFFFPRSHPD